MRTLLERLDWIPGAAGPVWVLLTIGMVYSLRLLWLRQQAWGKLEYALLAFIILCWLHPVYSYPDPIRIGFVGDVLTLLIALPLTYFVWQALPKAGYSLVAVSVWVAAAGLYLGLVLRYRT